MSGLKSSCGVCREIAVLSLAVVLSAPALADHGSLGFGLGTASPIITDTGVTLPQGMWATGLRTQYISFDRYSSSQMMAMKANAKDDAHGDIHSVDSFLQPSAFAAYGVTDDLSLGIRVPYNFRFNVRQPNDANTAVNNLGDAAGLGDITAFGQYRFFHSEDNLTNVSALAGLKMPTGESTVRTRVRTPIDPDTGTGGAYTRFETHHQPGSDSWDPMLGVAFTQGLGQFSLDSSLMYTFVNQGAQHTNLGDIFNYNIALSYAVGSGPVRSGLQASSNNVPLTLVLELNGEWRAPQSTLSPLTGRGAVDPNSGSNIVYISPGVRYAGGSNWNMALSVGAPIVADHGGNQVDPSYRIVNRIAVTF
ncbi:transporter [Methylogaea oryzae]|nr:transporter [Methylogaea oryzae]